MEKQVLQFIRETKEKMKKENNWDAVYAIAVIEGYFIGAFNITEE